MLRGDHSRRAERSDADRTRPCLRSADRLYHRAVDESGWLRRISPPKKNQPQHWRFSGAQIRRARSPCPANDLGVNLAGAALALQLLDEIEESPRPGQGNGRRVDLQIEMGSLYLVAASPFFISQQGDLTAWSAWVFRTIPELGYPSLNRDRAWKARPATSSASARLLKSPLDRLSLPRRSPWRWSVLDGRLVSFPAFQTNANQNGVPERFIKRRSTIPGPEKRKIRSRDLIINLSWRK